MTKTVRFFLLSLMFLAGRAGSTSLDATLDNTAYARKDLLYSTEPLITYSEGFSAALEKLGATNLSLYTNLGLSDAFLDSGRNNFDLRTLYLDAPVSSAFDAKIGRQLIYDLVSKGDYLDAVKLEYDLVRGTGFSGYVGAPVPSRYGNEFINLDPRLLQSALRFDDVLLPSTSFGAEVGHETDSLGTQHLPVAGDIESHLGKLFSLKADAVYDANLNTMDEYGIDISGRPIPALRWKAYVLGESKCVDSTNAYDSLVLGKNTDAGLEIGWSGRRDYARAYYSVLVLNNGTDQLAGAAVSVKGIFLDAESGSGVSGSSLKLAAGYAYDFSRALQCGAAVSSYVFKLSQNLSQEQSLTTRAYANWTIPGTGISVAPEAQFLSNEYYRTDWRFLLNIQYHLLTFWKS